MYFQRWCVRKRNAIRDVIRSNSDWWKSYFMNDARLARVTFVFVFVLGVTFAVFLSFVSNYLSVFKEDTLRETKVKVFSPLPFESRPTFHIDEEKLGLSIRKADVEPSGKPMW